MNISPSNILKMICCKDFRKKFPEKVVTEIFSKKLLPIQKGVAAQDTTGCPKDKLDRSWLSPCLCLRLVISYSNKLIRG